MTDFRTILLYLRRNYKPLYQISLELNVDYTSLKKACRADGKSFYYDTGRKIVDLYERVKND